MEDAEKVTLEKSPVNKFNTIAPQGCSQGCFNGWMTFVSRDGDLVPCPNCNPDGKLIV